jgi:hypothetical protein
MRSECLSPVAIFASPLRKFHNVLWRHVIVESCLINVVDVVDDSGSKRMVRAMEYFSKLVSDIDQCILSPFVLASLLTRKPAPVTEALKQSKKTIAAGARLLAT